MLCLTISSFPDNASIGVYTEFGQNVLPYTYSWPKRPTFSDDTAIT